MFVDCAATEAVTEITAGLMTGFPPSPELQVDVSNWQQPQNVRWAFRHMREIMPTQLISAGTGRPRPLSTTRTEFGNPVVVRVDGSSSTVEEIFADTLTDALIVVRGGEVVDERYFAGMTETTRHLVMSVSKSVVGCVAGVSGGTGPPGPQAAVTDYVPEVAGSGYRCARVRDVLDMRTGVAFRETYTALDSEVRIMERSVGWAPALANDPRGAYAYLATIRPEGPHGGAFTYRSADTDMLGWVCERAAGERMADLISTLIWQPMGAEFDAEITCDPVALRSTTGASRRRFVTSPGSPR